MPTSILFFILFSQPYYTLSQIHNTIKIYKNADSTCFVEFMLQTLYDMLIQVSQSDYDTDHVSDQENDYVKRLLTILNDKELSITEIMLQLGLKHKLTFRKNYLNPALEKGLIERTIPDKPRSKNQKYRIKKSEKISK